jgi:outer membrane protein TolC
MAAQNSRLKCWLFLAIFSPVLVYSVTTPAEASSPSLTLREAISIALRDHPALREAELNLRATQLELDLMRMQNTLPGLGLRLQPTSSIAASGSPWTSQAGAAATLALPWGLSLTGHSLIGFNHSANAWSTSYGLSLSQRLSPATADAAELAAKEEALARAQRALQSARSSVILDVIGRFGGQLVLQSASASAARALERARAQLAQVQAAVEAGQAGERQRLEAALTVKTAEITFRKRTLESTIAQQEFAALLGTDQRYDLALPQFALDVLSQQLNDLFESEISDAAVSASEGVQRALEARAAAQRALWTLEQAARPAAAVAVGLDSKGWQFGITIEFDLLSPTRGTRLELARAALALAQERLRSAQQAARLALFTQRAALRQAWEAVELLPLEAERWALEETITRQRGEAGLISAADWTDFQNRQADWESSRLGKTFELVSAYLRYRELIGVPLRWEEILR